MMEAIVGDTKLTLVRGDITQEDTEAVVNAANIRLRGGGGVDGAIHRTGGPEIMAECNKIRAERGGCPTGEAVITTGGKLKARYVIHTVGPVWSGGRRQEEDDELLASAYRSSLTLAKEQGIQTISFPSISTGAYGFPIDRAARIALTTVCEFLQKHSHSFEEIRFVLFSDGDLEAYERAWKEIAGSFSRDF